MKGSDSSRTLRWATQRHPKGRRSRSSGAGFSSIESGKGLLAPTQEEPAGVSASVAHPEQSQDSEIMAENMPELKSVTSGDSLHSVSQQPHQASADHEFSREQSPTGFKSEDARGSYSTIRTVFFNMPVTHFVDEEERTHFTRNKIRTSKYTPLTFVPKNLYYQFHNVANIYFLFIVILQIFSIFGAANPGLGAVPLVVILVVTAFKDAVEDWRRTVLDNELNNTLTRTLHGWNNVNSREEKVSSWRKLKKAVSHSIKRTYEKKNRRRLSYSNTAWELERSTSGSIVRLSEQSERPSRFSSDMRDYQTYYLPRISHDLGGAFNVDAFNSHANHNNQIAQAMPTSNKPGSVVDKQRYLPETAKFRRSYWKDVRVGDFVLLKNDEPVPADMVVLTTSDSDGACYVETKNLDGETNLKVRHALRCGFEIKSALDCEAATFWVECETPHANLFSFSGVAKWYMHNSETSKDEVMAEPISIDSMLLRGCSIKNTKWVIGVVVFTGSETKIMLNSGITPSKRSRITREMNKYVIINFVILFVMCFVVGTLNGLSQNDKTNSGRFFDLGVIGGSAAASGVVTFFTGVILFQNLVPISLYISIEIVKLCQVFFIWSDIDMYDEILDYPCTPKSWNISDDLGQIEYIFSDKTGTLTQNVMEFKKCTINGVMYGEAFTEAMAGLEKRKGNMTENLLSKAQQKIETDRQLMLSELDQVYCNPYVDKDKITFVSSEFVKDMRGANGEKRSEDNKFFLLALALCHSVLTEKISGNPNRIEFKAQSPDEAALVSTARDMGFSLTDRTQRGVLVDVLGTINEYRVLNTLEFNSSRKRMSAIIRLPHTGKVMLFCKGADNVIFSRLRMGKQMELREKTLHDLNVFANEGLRTLCIAYRELDEETYATWNAKYVQAAAAVDDREAKLEEVADSIERELTLLGGTAIEDRLQEGVPDTIQLLADGGIKLWVLTGDRVETAVNIGFSCNLLTTEMELILFQVTPDMTVQDAEHKLDDYLNRYFDMRGDEEEYKRAKQDHNPPPSTHALIIDGDALKLALDPFIQLKFLLLCKRCKSVICCRVSPSQKAKVVRMVKKGLDVMTLSIGDGANDVAMIQEADVGVGIAGEEGRQAVMSADYAIGLFRFLGKLVIVHGAWSYRRIAQMIANFFYKNLVWTLTLFWYQIFTNFNGTYLFDYTYILLYNLAFTSLGVIFMGVLEQDVDAETALQTPQLYKRGILRLEWTHLRFWTYMLDGLYQSLICFFFPYLLYYTATPLTHNGIGIETFVEMGIFVAAISVTSVNLFFLMNQRSWDWLFLVIIAFSLLIFWFWSGVYSQFLASPLFYKAPSHIFGTANFWAIYIVSIVACLLPHFICQVVIKFYFPMDNDIIREIAYGIHKAHRGNSNRPSSSFTRGSSNKDSSM